MRQTLMRSVLVIAIGAGLLNSAGCATKTGTGALVGGLGGAGIGAAIGSGSGHAGRGALIGGAIGTIGGAVVGNSMDQQDRKREQARADQQRYEERQRRQYADEPPRRNSLAPAGPAKSSAVTVDTVINWWNDGESEEDILDRIDRSKTVFRLTAADEERMRDEGVSDAIIKEMKRSGRQAAAE